MLLYKGRMFHFSWIFPDSVAINLLEDLALFFFLYLFTHYIIFAISIGSGTARFIFSVDSPQICSFLNFLCALTCHSCFIDQDYENERSLVLHIYWLIIRLLFGDFSCNCVQREYIVKVYSDLRIGSGLGVIHWCHGNDTCVHRS